ncbi:MULTISPECIES: autotransporter assembly complex family protein [unclassified Moraxella]|uniref:autotransporter assembly complex protein TamA n=1 Tax=unclassified Moraxella TaxID=2685852 RepID=UPI00359E7D73
MKKRLQADDKITQGGQGRLLRTTLSLAMLGLSYEAWASKDTQDVLPNSTPIADIYDDSISKTLKDGKSLLNEQIEQSAQSIADISLYTPAQIQARLENAAQENPLLVAQAEADFISRLDDDKTPVGLDVDSITKIPTPDTLQTLGLTTEDGQSVGIDPRAYIPQRQPQLDDAMQVVIEEDEIKQPNIVKRLYSRLFNDGVEAVVRLDTEFYHSQNHSLQTPIKLKKGELKQEPFANIKAALEDITAESVRDFNSALPRLRQTVQSAARAVGYYEVDFGITKREVGKVAVIIHELGEPVRIASQVLEVRGEGVKNPAYQKATEKANLSFDDTFHHGHYEAAKGAITEVSAEQGYFDGRWLSNSADVILPDNLADVNLIYDSGEQYEFDEVVFFTFDEETKQLTTDPSKLPVKAELLKKLVTFKMGDAYNRTAVRNLSNNLLATGYFNAVNTELVLPTANSASTDDDQNISLEAESGEVGQSELVDMGDGVVLEVSPIEFTASQVVQDKLALVTQKAERLYSMPEDRLLVTDTHRQSKSILGRISDAVSSVAKMILPDESRDVADSFQGAGIPTLAHRKTPQQVHTDKKVPLYIFVGSDKPRDAQIGLGWGSDGGASLIAKFEHNLINKDGYQAGADVRLSQEKKGVGLYVTRPLTHPLNDKLRASLSYNEEVVGGSVGTFDLRAKTLQQSISRNIINESGWNRSYSLRYRLDGLETGVPIGLWSDLPVRFIDGKPRQEALLAGYAINKNTFDNPVNPMRGYSQNYSVEVGAKGLVTDTNMAIVRAGVGGIYSFGDNAYGKDRAHQLIGSLNAGYLWANDFESVPYKLRFFAGGDHSIRGYSYESLSPISDKGYLTGGQALAVASGEYNYEVMNGLRLAAFADVGNAYDKNFSNATKIGAGVGVRWASPVGQVRVDVATGVGEKGNPIKLHFFIGTPF